MDTSNQENQTGLVIGEPSYRLPDLIDNQLAQLVAERGAHSTTVKDPFGLVIIIGIVAIVSCLVLSSIDLKESQQVWIGWLLVPLDVVLVLVLASPCVLALLAWASFSTARVQRAFRDRRYESALRLLPEALWSAGKLSKFSPSAHKQFQELEHIRVQILILESRVSEFEISSRFMWTALERRAVTEGVPNNFVIADNLAMSWFLQGKYAQASTLFAATMSDQLPLNDKLLLLNNLALCQIREKELDGAEATLCTALQLLGDQAPNNWKFKSVQAALQTERGNFVAAENCLEDVRTIAKKENAISEVEGEVTSLLARIRYKQGRLDESEQLYKKRIDSLSSSDHPPYLDLAEYLHVYAQVQQALGREESAKNSLKRAQEYYQYYVEREKATVAKIKEILQNPKKRLRTGADLLIMTPPKPLVLSNGAIVG